MIGLLSIPTWLIHFGSVIEWAVAMGLFYTLGRRTGNVWLKRMPLFMLPYGLSGLCAIAFHISADSVVFFNDAQAYLTLAGSCAFALWAWLLLRDLTQASPRTQARRPQSKAKLSYSLRQTSTKNQDGAAHIEQTEEVRRG